MAALMCSISWQKFLEDANEFINLSEMYKDSWSLFEKDKEEGNSYLVFRQKLKVCFDDGKIEEELTDMEIKENDLETLEMDTESVKHIESAEELIEIEYHVVYSISYQVPILYFRGYRSDGKPIALDDAWKIFRNPIGDTKTRKNMLSTLTQTDHPVLFKPFLGLHPCRTGELLSQMGSSQNAIVTFLSIMGPYVQLNLKNEYGLAFRK